MAFTAFGSLGSTGAAGFLGGMQTAAQRIEEQRQTKDTEAMQMYSKLLESGEWEPVGPDGAADGGVLRIGTIGMLKRVKPTLDLKKMWQIKNLQSLVTTREKAKTPAEGEIRTLAIQIVGPKGGKIPGKQVEEYIDGQWRKKGGKVVSSRPLVPGSVTTWVKPETGERVNKPTSEGAPAGPMWEKLADVSREQRFTRQQNMDQARIVGTELKGVRTLMKRAAKWLETERDESSREGQDRYIDLYIEAAGLDAEQKAWAKGAPAEIRNRLVEEAQAKARRELAEKYPEPEPEEEEGLLDWILKRISLSSEATKEEQEFTPAPMIESRSKLLQRGQPPFRRLP